MAFCFYIRQSSSESLAEFSLCGMSVWKEKKLFSAGVFSHWQCSYPTLLFWFIASICPFPSMVRFSCSLNPSCGFPIYYLLCLWSVLSSVEPRRDFTSSIFFDCSAFAYLISSHLFPSLPSGMFSLSQLKSQSVTISSWFSFSDLWTMCSSGSLQTKCFFCRCFSSCRMVALANCIGVWDLQVHKSSSYHSELCTLQLYGATANDPFKTNPFYKS